MGSGMGVGLLGEGGRGNWCYCMSVFFLYSPRGPSPTPMHSKIQGAECS